MPPTVTMAGGLGTPGLRPGDDVGAVALRLLRGRAFEPADRTALPGGHGLSRAEREPAARSRDDLPLSATPRAGAGRAVRRGGGPGGCAPRPVWRRPNCAAGRSGWRGCVRRRRAWRRANRSARTPTKPELREREQKDARGRIPDKLSTRERMRRTLTTQRGRRLYEQRRWMIEPVFGQTKENRGIRRFQRPRLQHLRQRVETNRGQPQPAQALSPPAAPTPARAGCHALHRGAALL